MNVCLCVQSNQCSCAYVYLRCAYVYLLLVRCAYVLLYFYVFMSPSQHNSPVGPRDTPSKEQVHVPTTLIDLESHKEPWGWNERIAPTMWLLHMTNHVKGSSRSSSHLMVMPRVFFQEQFPPHGCGSISVLTAVPLLLIIILFLIPGSVLL